MVIGTSRAIEAARSLRMIGRKFGSIAERRRDDYLTLVISAAAKLRALIEQRRNRHIPGQIPVIPRDFRQIKIYQAKLHIYRYLRHQADLGF
jgi:hypothetical protein